jgi:O-antigen/teichoic acid export membrane protein
MARLWRSDLNPSDTGASLRRNGYALAANTAISSGLGAVYWVVAARLYPTEDVGINAAMISAMIFLAKLAQLNMVNGLNRFVPRAGANTHRLVAGSYAVSVPLAVIFAVVFVAGLDTWAPRLGVIRSDPAVLVGFVVATALWAVFVLQDAALIGLRKSTWVPVENGVYGVVKILMLALLAGAAPAIGIFASWTVPLIVMLVAVNVLVFSRAIPEHVARSGAAPAAFEAKAVARYAAADLMGSLGWLATIHLLPVIVLGLAGAEASAHFYLPWVIAFALVDISRNVGMSLITEASLDPDRLAAYGRSVLRQTGIIVIPAALGIIALAPRVLDVFGAEYSAEGATLLRLLAAAAVPKIAVSLYVAILRVERRMTALFVLYLALGTGVLGTSVVLLPRIGIVGVGIAWLGTLSLLATGLLATGLRSALVRSPGQPFDRTTVEATAHAAHSSAPAWAGAPGESE